MPRLHDPDPDLIPEDVGRFLADFPPDPMFKMLSHSVTTIQPLIGLAQALYTSLELPIRTRELAILTVAGAVESDFVWAQHLPISESAGVGEEIRQLIRNQDYENPALSPQDNTIIRFVAEIVAGPNVADTLFSSLRNFLSERQVVELLHVIGYYWTFSRMSTVLQVELTHLYAGEHRSGWPGRDNDTSVP